MALPTAAAAAAMHVLVVVADGGRAAGALQEAAKGCGRPAAAMALVGALWIAGVGFDGLTGLALGVLQLRSGFIRCMRQRSL